MILLLSVIVPFSRFFFTKGPKKKGLVNNGDEVRQNVVGTSSLGSLFCAFAYVLLWMKNVSLSSMVFLKRAFHGVRLSCYSPSGCAPLLSSSAIGTPVPLRGFSHTDSERRRLTERLHCQTKTTPPWWRSSPWLPCRRLSGTLHVCWTLRQTVVFVLGTESLSICQRALCWESPRSCTYWHIENLFIIFIFFYLFIYLYIYLCMYLFIYLFVLP